MRARSIFGLLMFVTPASADAEIEPPLLAVLDLEDGGANLGPDVQAQLKERLVKGFEDSGRFRLVASDQVKRHLAERKQPCRDQACRREIGSALGADQTLAAKVVRIGSNCVVTARLLDLRTTAEEVATNEGACTDEGLQRSIEENLARLIPVAPGCAGAPGRATFGSVPMGAAVFVNGVELGTTPLIAKLPSGCVHQVRLVAPDGRERVESIKLQANKHNVYKIAFEPSH